MGETLGGLETNILPYQVRLLRQVGGSRLVGGRKTLPFRPGT